MIGFITGLASEADCLAALADSRVRVAGIGPGNAARCARDLIAMGCTRLISFGIAGGLAADLKPGAIVIADSVITPDNYKYPTDTMMAVRLLAALPNAVRRPIAGSDTMIATPAEKALLAQRTGASAVDMESHQIVRVAHEAHIGFIALRAVCDPQRATLPAAARRAIGSDGRPSIRRVLAQLARDPRELPDLIKLGLYSRAAHESLRGIAPVIAGYEGGL